jgi:hypothetical protein
MALSQQAELIMQMQQQIAGLSEQVQTLQERFSKESHKSHLPPSSDRLSRQSRTKSLRKRAGNSVVREYSSYLSYQIAFTGLPHSVIPHKGDVL